MKNILTDGVLWSKDMEKNMQTLKEAGVDFSLKKRELINVCDSAC